MNKQTDVKSGEFRTDAQAAAEKVELHEMTIAQRELWLGKTFPRVVVQYLGLWAG